MIFASGSTSTAKQRHQPDDRTQPQRHVAAVDVHLVVVEAVLLVPQARAAERVDGVGDVDEVLEEFRGDVLHARIERRQFQGHREHRAAVEGHPGGAVGLLQLPAARQRLGAVEDADVVQPQKAAGEEVLAAKVLAVHPPGEVHQQLLEDRGEEAATRRAFGRARRIL